jgi:hypothetical protein
MCLRSVNVTVLSHKANDSHSIHVYSDRVTHSAICCTSGSHALGSHLGESVILEVVCRLVLVPCAGWFKEIGEIFERDYKVDCIKTRQQDRISRATEMTCASYGSVSLPILNSTL